MTLRRGHIKAASFTHSAVYAGLLAVWLGDGPDTLNAFFGWAHGLGWFAMCALAVIGLRRRLVDLKLAVAIAVLGAVGPFLGTAEFVRQDRRPRASAASHEARWAGTELTWLSTPRSRLWPRAPENR